LQIKLNSIILKEINMILNILNLKISFIFKTTRSSMIFKIKFNDF
jgi:hypothetical protein